MGLPQLLDDTIQGLVLAHTTEVEEIKGSLSVFGTKTVALTDGPRVFLHDQGLLGEERVLEADPMAGDADLRFVDGSTVLTGMVRFGDGTEVRLRVTPVPEPLGDYWLRAAPADDADDERGARFSTRFPVSIVCDFNQSRSELIGELGNIHESAANLAAFRHLDDVDALDASEQLKVSVPRDRARAAALISHLEKGEFTARVVIVGERLRLLRRGVALVDAHLRSLEVHREQSREVTLSGGVMVAGCDVSRIRIVLPSTATARRLLDALPGGDAPAGEGPGAVSPARGARAELVHARGQLGADQPIDARVDAVLSPEGLEIRSAEDGSRLARFSFSDPELRVAGTTERFVLASPTAGPLVIAEGAERFRQQLVANEGAVAAARRTLESARFPVFCDGAPVLVTVGEQAIDFSGPVTPVRRIGWDALRSVRTCTGDGAESLELYGAATPVQPPQRVQVEGERLVLTALSKAVSTRAFLREFAGRPTELVATVLGLERDYFVYSLVGPLYELHRVLASADGDEPGTTLQPLALPGSLDARLRRAQVLAAGIEPIRRHLTKALHYLPAALAGWDAELASRIGAGGGAHSARTFERSYRAAFAPLQQLLAEVLRIREWLLQVHGVDAKLEKGADYGAAAVSLALGMVNPLMLAGAVNQAYSARKLSAREKSEIGDRAERLLERANDTWNELVFDTAPALWHQVLDATFPLRTRLYAGLTRAGSPAVTASADAPAGADAARSEAAVGTGEALSTETAADLAEAALRAPSDGAAARAAPAQAPADVAQVRDAPAQAKAGDATATDDSRQLRVLAERLAALTAFLQYPEEGSTGPNRGQIVALARDVQSRLHYGGFHPF